jgi:hypothetical protein
VLMTMMDVGKQVLINCATLGESPGIINSYDIGTDFNITLDSSQTDVSPLPAIFTGDITTIYKTIVTENEVIFTVYLPYNLTFPIGNVMIMLTDNVPFLWLSMSQSFFKEPLNDVEHYAGDIYLISFVVKYPNITTVMDLSNLSNFYAQAPLTTDVTTMVDVWHSEPEQQQIDNFTSPFLPFNLGRPAYCTTVNYHWYSVPFAMSYDDVRFFQIDGGNVGDGYVYVPQLTGSK